ncbi:YCF48-related protein [Fulvivirga ulvae]|uniref:WD40/YVTN/BNR-like repeat-containing protein n=1 Tax=Fulvivirga ulvae TaxID=2904245 RepID=UPI001F2EA543|nr:YCF48-related protein [Fulvivirga ulvae]UII34878.1 YCF48-related protein [Fulvivirga ulvae]
MSYFQLILTLIFSAGSGVTWQLYTLEKEASLRGIAAVDENVCWVGGSNSVLAKTTDGGSSWQYYDLVKAPDAEFRDIQAFGPDTVIVMSAGEGDKSKIFKTTDGGNTWRTVLENKFPKGFFNGIAFWNSREGILTGDPIDGKLFVMTTADAGESWQRVTNLPDVVENEYGFAASGSHITVQGDHVWIGTGGTVARIFHSADKGANWEVVNTPMLQGEPSLGIFSMAVSHSGMGLAVGGDYTDEEGMGDKNLIYSQDNGSTWNVYEGHSMPFRSAVRFVNDMILITGPSGSEYSGDNGRSWMKVNGMGFHTLDVGNNGVVWAAGSGGRIGKMKID